MASDKGNRGAASDLHISDVLDVIEHDPEYTGQAQQQTTAPAASATLSQPPPSAASTLLRNIEAASMLNSTASAVVDPELEAKRRAFVKILEQPASKALRFRYECEGRSAGSIPGAKSTADTKTYPTIQVVGYRGRAVVVVSCVTKDVPYRPHPHSLVGKEGCKKGVCTLEINNESMTCTFSNLGIQCVKKKGIEEALKQREEIRVDPFHTGFSHRNQPQAIDLNAVRLCFQVFLEGAQRGKFTFPLKPIVSDPIFDKKAMCDLTICKLSDFTSPVAGGKEIIMLCDKVTKDDIQVRFYQEVDGQLEWEGFGDFTASDVHKQVAISFRTPRYKNNDIDGPIDAWIQLRRPSDGATSESRPFQFIPMDTDAEVLKRKRSRLGESNASHLVAYIQSNAFENLTRHPAGAVVEHADVGGSIGTRSIRHINRTKIKKEPIDAVAPEETGKVNSPGGYSFDAYAPPNVAAFMPRYPLNPAMPFTANISPYPQSVSPNPPFQYMQPFPVSPSMGYNIPAHSPVPGTSEAAKAKRDTPMVSGNSYMDLDTSNIHQAQRPPDGGDLNDCLPSICLPMSDSNDLLIQEHLLENLSISLSNLDVSNDVNDRVASDALNNLDPPAGKPSNVDESKNNGARPKAPSQAQSADPASAMNISISDFPELPQFCSADLEGADGFAPITSSSALIKEIEDLNTLSKPSNAQ